MSPTAQTFVGPTGVAHELKELAWSQNVDTTFRSYRPGSFEKSLVCGYEVRPILLRLEDMARIVCDILGLSVACEGSLNRAVAGPFARGERYAGGVDQPRRLRLHPGWGVGVVDLSLVRVRQKDAEVLGLVKPKKLIRGCVLRMILRVEGATRVPTTRRIRSIGIA
jgi:hypothetical protein